jgi:hypothetical protein
VTASRFGRELLHALGVFLALARHAVAALLDHRLIPRRPRPPPTLDHARHAGLAASQTGLNPTSLSTWLWCD